MEIINDNRMPEDNFRNRDRRERDVAMGGHIYLGIMLVLVGVLWLFYNFGWVGYRVWDFLISWQMLLIAIGGYLLAIRKWTAGIIVGALGVLFVLVDMLDVYVNVWKIALPSVIIVLGISLLVSKLKDRDR